MDYEGLPSVDTQVVDNLSSGVCIAGIKTWLCHLASLGALIRHCISPPEVISFPLSPLIPSLSPLLSPPFPVPLSYPISPPHYFPFPFLFSFPLSRVSLCSSLWPLTLGCVAEADLTLIIFLPEPSKYSWALRLDYMCLPACERIFLSLNSLVCLREHKRRTNFFISHFLNVTLLWYWT